MRCKLSDAYERAVGRLTGFVSDLESGESQRIDGEWVSLLGDEDEELISMNQPSIGDRPFKYKVDQTGLRHRELAMTQLELNQFKIELKSLTSQFHKAALECS